MKRKMASELRMRNTAQTSEAPKEQLSAKERIEKTYLSVVATRERTLQLHTQWRSYLLRVSVATLFVSMHQLQQPLQYCWKDLRETSLTPPSLDWLHQMASQSNYEILNFLIASFLVYFIATRQKRAPTLTEATYAAACTAVPICVYFYSSNREMVPQCRDLLESSEIEERARQFPVGLILHTVITIACHFMKIGVNSCEENIKIVEDLRIKLADAKATQKKNQILREKLSKKSS